MNNKVATLANNNTNDDEKMTKMCAAMDDLHQHHQTLEDNVLHIQQRYQEADPLVKDEVLVPNLSQMKYEGHQC